MANEEQLSILKQGVNVWNEWREENPEAEVDLSDALLDRMDLSRANFHKANLSGVNLSFSNLRGASLIRTCLVGAKLEETVLTAVEIRQSDLRAATLLYTELTIADLKQVNLRKSYISGANLTMAALNQADLSDTYLHNSNLSQTKLVGTNFSNASIGLLIFADTDLSQAIGLENASFHARSSLGIDTIYHSKGKIPEAFLRGCGLSEIQMETAKLATPGLDPEQVTDINYKIHQLYLGGIRYYSCFISYSSKDEAFAKQVYDDLQNNGVRCWFAPEHMKIGDQIRSRIDQEIRRQDKLLVILSENSVKSEWVGDEVEAALEEESKNDRLVLFPIRLDDAVMNTRDDWAAMIKRRRHIGDFSNWKDKSSYQKAFERLLRELKARGGQVNGE